MNISDYLSKQLQTGEDVVQIIRRHPVTMFPAVGGGALLVLVDFFFIAWLFQYHQWGAIVFGVVALLGMVIIIRGVYIWSHNVLVVTSHRVIDIDQHGFFERNVAEATYDKVQDVRYTIRGFWSTIMRYGTIIVQTAGTTTNLELDAVQRPMELQRLITDLQHQSATSVVAPRDSDNLTEVVERLKAELGTAGVVNLLRNSSSRVNGQAKK